MSDVTSPAISDERALTPRELWATEVEYAEKEVKKFHERGEQVVRRFLDERDAFEAGQKWFNLFYANTKILKAALYAQVPKPEVTRRFADYNDDVARVAATILQRNIAPDGDDPRDLFDTTMRNCVLDRLVPGLGIAWLRLETDVEEAKLILEQVPYAYPLPENSGFQSGPSPDGVPPPAPPVAVPPMPGAGAQPGPQGPTNVGQAPVPQPQVPPQPEPQIYKKITDQRVCIDYVFWKDFIWSPCRVWSERRWVGRAVYLSREDLIKRFGEEKGSKVPLNHRPTIHQLDDKVQPTNVAIKRAKVYEIWDRINRKVIWFSKDFQDLLDEKEDFLNLIGFEPCPTPLFANIVTSNTVPRPDFYLVQDQYNELDTINNRISLLVRAIKVVGVYDQASVGVQRMLNEAVDNQLIPVDNWAMFAEKGGIKGQVDWLPLEQITNALGRLYEAREAIKAQIYELTGIADIVRGASKASETLGAQEIKAKFASVRIKDVQDEAARFASEILRIKAEIMVKHFDPEILKRKSNIMRTDDAQMADTALGLLKSEEGFEWRIQVTTDQLAQTDYNLEKQDRIELLTSVSGYLQTAGQMISSLPAAAPLLVAILKWAVAGFKGARDIETMLDRELDKLQKEGTPPPDEDPAKVKAEADAKAKQQEAQQRAQESQQRMQEGQQKMALAAQTAQIEIRGKQQENVMEMQRDQQDLRAEAARNAMELRNMAQKNAIEISHLHEKGKIMKQQSKSKPNGAQK